MRDQDRVLTHAQNFEPHPSAGCHSPPKNGVVLLSFMPHLISLLISGHMSEKSSQINFIKRFACGANFQFHNRDLLEKAHWNYISQYKTVSSRTISLNHLLCIAHLTKNVSPPFILFVASTMHGLPYPFPQTYHLGETLQIVEKSRPVSKKYPCPEPENSSSPIQASSIAAVSAAISFFNDRLYVQIYHANFDLLGFTESYLQNDKSIE